MNTNLEAWNKINLLSYRSVSQLMGLVLPRITQGIVWVVVLQGHLRKNVSLVLPALQASHLPWFMVPCFIFKASSVTWLSALSPAVVPLPEHHWERFSTFRHLCDHTGTIWMIQNNHPISRCMPVNTSVKSLFSCKLTYSQVPGIMDGHLWSPLFCLSQYISMWIEC